MELEAAGPGQLCSGRLTMHINKVHHVKTISRVAKELGEDEDWLFEIAIGMEVEDGVRRWRNGLHRLRHREPDRPHQNPQGRSPGKAIVLKPAACALRRMDTS